MTTRQRVAVSRRYDRCSVCRRIYRLLKDGTVSTHRAPGVAVCPGAGVAPGLYDPHECPECMSYYLASPYLVEAAASVGIERGRSTSDMLWLVLAEYHRNRHTETETES